MELKNIFLKGVMNKDHDERLVPQNQYIHAENIQVIKSEGSDSGAVENVYGNKKMTDKDFGANPLCIGGVEDESQEILYYCVASDSGSYIMEWDHNKQELNTVLEDKRVEGENVLNFDKDHLITGIDLFIDSEKDNRLLLINDDLNPPRCINVERAKTYGPENFREEQINLIKKPPLYAPTITTVKADPDQENNLRDKFISFATRYKYLDGEYSALSPFSEIAFHAEDFYFDFPAGSNEGMVNRIGKAIIAFSTGSDLVTDIEVVFKECGSSNLYFVESFNKEEEGWGDLETQSTEFSNNKITKILPEKELLRLYDNVPHKVKSQTLIGNRILFGNYVENYDLKGSSGEPIHADLELSLKAREIMTPGSPYKTAKSLRTYEAGIAYLDDYGRMTTVLTGGDNTVHVPVKNSVTQNTLSLKIKNNPPEFATKYRIFLKQNKEHYDTVVGTRFFPDGVYVWLKMGPTDIDKFKEGDYLIVKSDTSGPVDRYIETRVIEIKDQPANFLVIEQEKDEDEEDGVVPIKQEAGTYFKLKPEEFNLTQQDMESYEWEVFNSSYDESIYYDSSYIELPSYYGTRGLNDMTSLGTYNKHDKDIRYLIHIDSVNNVVYNDITGQEVVYDTFKWSEDNGQTWKENVWITENPIDLSNGVQVQFENLTGHSRTDNWVVPAKGKDAKDFGGDQDHKAHLIIKGPKGDHIYAGAQIDLFVREEQKDDSKENEWSFTSTRDYDNLEEWFYGDGIDKVVEGKFHTYWFRRGLATRSSSGNRGRFYQNTQEEVRQEDNGLGQILGGANPYNRGEVSMIIRSSYTKNNFLDKEAEMFGNLKVLQSKVLILFETKKKITNSDIFFEQSKTYDIVNGIHMGGFTSFGGHEIPFFNAFTWGNGFESYKVKDDIAGNALLLDSRPHGTVEEYKQKRRKASLTYSNVYEQSTGYNALNEFNLATANFKDLDTGYGSIQKLHSRDNNVLVIREDKTSQLLFNKAVLYNADGTANVQQTTQVLGDDVPYAGEFGIGLHPESFVDYGTWLSWVDPVRGKVIKLGGRGLFAISDQLMSSHFRGLFKDSKDIKCLGGYDPYTNKVLYCLGEEPTVAYDISGEGWSGFYSFKPDWMLRLGSRLFTIKEGQVYLHNDPTVPANNFYGEQFKSLIRFASNQEPSAIKVYKSIGIEGNKPWDVEVKTFQSGSENFKLSTVSTSEFIKKEGYWYAHIRRNELEGDTSSKATYGIGVVESKSGFNINVGFPADSVMAGDKLYTESGELIGAVGTVSGSTITVDTTVLDIEGQYIYGTRPSRVEGSTMRGYTAVIEMTNDATDKVELFATNTNVFKSNR